MPQTQETRCNSACSFCFSQAWQKHIPHTFSVDVGITLFGPHRKQMHRHVHKSVSAAISGLWVSLRGGAATGREPFLRKRLRRRWPTSKRSHLYSAAATRKRRKSRFFSTSAKTWLWTRTSASSCWDVSRKTDRHIQAVPDG